MSKVYVLYEGNQLTGPMRPIAGFTNEIVSRRVCAEYIKSLKREHFVHPTPVDRQICVDRGIPIVETDDVVSKLV